MNTNLIDQLNKVCEDLSCNYNGGHINYPYAHGVFVSAMRDIPLSTDSVKYIERLIKTLKDTSNGLDSTSK